MPDLKFGDTAMINDIKRMEKRVEAKELILKAHSLAGHHMFTEILVIEGLVNSDEIGDYETEGEL